MPYRTKDKTTMHIRLSHFLYNGLDVASAKLDMSMSEVVRMAIYEWLKSNFTKKELDYFSFRDDVVDELVDAYREKGRSGSIDVGGYKDELDEKVKKGELEYVEDDEDKLRKLKLMYLKKYGDDPDIAELIKKVDTPGTFDYIRGVRNRDEILGLLEMATTQPVDYHDVLNDKKKEKHDKKKKK